MDASLQFLTLYPKHGEDILDQEIIGDKTWVHYYTPLTKQESIDLMKKDEHPRVKAKTEGSVNKLMVTVFWDKKGAILTYYTSQGTTINADNYCQVL